MTKKYITHLGKFFVYALCCLTVSYAQVDSSGLMQLVESIKSDAAAGKFSEMRQKVEQVKSSVEAMCGRESVEYLTISLMMCPFDAMDSPRTAMEIAKESLAKLEEADAPASTRATGYATLCTLYWRLNQPRLALEAGRKVLALADELPEAESQQAKRNILIYMVEAESARGDYDAAENYFKQLEALPPDPADSSGGLAQVNMLMSKADLLVAKGDLAEAELIYLDCLKRLGVREDSEFGASVSGRVGAFYMQLGDYDRAAAFYKKAEASSKAIYGEESTSYAAALEHSAWVLFKQGKTEEAKNVALRALDLARKTGQGSNSGLLANITFSLAMIEQKLGDLDAAQRYAEESVSGYTEKADPLAKAPSLCLLAGILLEKGQIDEALRINTECSELLVKATGSESRWAARALAQRGAIFYLMGDKDKAREVALELVPLLDRQFEKILLMDERSRLAWQADQFSLGFEACVLPETDMADIVIRRKGAVLDSLLEDRARAHRFLDDQTAKKTLREITRIRARVAKLYFSNDPEERRDAELLSRKAAELERSLARASAASGVANKLSRPSAADIKASLGKDETFLAFFAFNDPKMPKGQRRSYGVLILPGDGSPLSVVRIGDAGAIDSSVDNYRKSLGAGKESELARSLGEIFRKVWTPVAAKIPATCTKLLIAPDGPLNFLSFAAIPDGDGAFVADQYSIAYVGSGRDLLRREKAAHEKSISIFANPRFDLSKEKGASGKMATRAGGFDVFGTLQLPPLPGTKAESDIIQDAARTEGWRAVAWEGSEASEGRLRKVDSPGILHLATHGFYLNSGAAFTPDSRGMHVVSASLETAEAGQSDEKGVDPMKASGIALSGAQATFSSWAKGAAPEPESDGVLTAEEIAALDLGDTWLVSLSACETGVGESRSGEGVLGLRRAFMMSGAENLLMTLWPVSDATTVDIMKEFYVEALTTGDAPASLSKIQKKWLAKLRQEKGLLTAVRDAGPFAIAVMARPAAAKAGNSSPEGATENPAMKETDNQRRAYEPPVSTTSAAPVGPAGRGKSQSPYIAVATSPSADAPAGSIALMVFDTRTKQLASDLVYNLEKCPEPGQTIQLGDYSAKFLGR